MKQGVNILVVDDEPLVRQSIKLLLKHAGHNTELADSAEAALARLSETAFDIVITDYCMPGMLGDELVARIRQVAPGQRIIMATAFVEEYKVFGRVNALLIKPFSFNDLTGAVDRVLAEDTSAEPTVCFAPVEYKGGNPCTKKL